MPHTSARHHHIILLLILLIGAWLRFQNLDDIEVNIDQVYPIWQAIQTLDAGEFPLAGQGTSVLFDNPPLTGYLYLPVIMLVRQPIAAYMFTLTLNTLAIWLAYRALHRLLGRYPALIGAALFAVNPWIVEDSRRTWVQALAPFFVTLVFWALTPVLTGQTQHPRRRTLIALIGVAVFAHTYLLAYAIVAPVGLLIVLFWRRIPKRPLIIGGALFALLMTLYGIGLAQEWERTQERTEEFSSGEARLKTEALEHALRLVTGGGYADQRGMDAPQDDADLRQSISDVISLIWVLLLALGTLLALYTLARPPDPQTGDSPARIMAVILLVWFLLPIIMMSYVSRVVHPFYLHLTLPAGHGLAAWGMMQILFAPNRRVWKPAPTMVNAMKAGDDYNRSSPSPRVDGGGATGGRVGGEVGFPLRPLRWIALGFLVITAGINGLNTVRFAQNTARVPGADLPETLPLGEATTLGQRLDDARDPGMAIISPMPEWTPIVLVGHDLRTEELHETHRTTLIPRDGAITVTFAGDIAEPVPPPLYGDIAGSPLVLDDHTVIALWRTTQDAVPITHPADIPSDIDVSFAGWNLDGELAAGRTATLDLFWRVDALHPDRGVWTFAPFAHLYGTGGRIAVFDGAVLSALTWAEGDLLVYRLLIDVPEDAAGPFSMQIGLFDSVRTREDGSPGVNAIFRVGDGDAAEYTAMIELVPGE